MSSCNLYSSIHSLHEMFGYYLHSLVHPLREMSAIHIVYSLREMSGCILQSILFARYLTAIHTAHPLREMSSYHPHSPPPSRDIPSSSLELSFARCSTSSARCSI